MVYWLTNNKVTSAFTKTPQTMLGCLAKPPTKTLLGIPKVKLYGTVVELLCLQFQSINFLPRKQGCIGWEVLCNWETGLSRLSFSLWCLNLCCLLFISLSLTWHSSGELEEFIQLIISYKLFRSISPEEVCRLKPIYLADLHLQQGHWGSEREVI